MGRLAIALALVLGARTAHAECKPTAVPDGDPELVKNLAVRLAANGIATTSTAGCPAVSVRVEQRGQQVHLRLADAFQRQGERDVRDVATAAAIVESWTMQVVEEGSLPALAPPPPSLPSWPRSGIAMDLGSAMATDSALWLGGGASACIAIGPTCAGGAVIAAADTRATGATSTLAQDTYAIAALATVDLPLHAGPVTISPGIGVGYRYQHLVTHHTDAMHNPLDVPQADHALATLAHVAVLRAISARVSLYGELSGDAALVRSDSTSGPAGSLWLAAGVRLEVP